jgi:serine phosphatase RsbU (regulator of sigma subunit)
VFRGEEEFGEERLFATFAGADENSAAGALATLWSTLEEFSGGAPQVDDMSAVALYRLGGAEGI